MSECINIDLSCIVGLFTSLRFEYNYVMFSLFQLCTLDDAFELWNVLNAEYIFSDFEALLMTNHTFVHDPHTFFSL